MHRITAIDIMQGIAMLLVVLGHHLFPFMPEWYRRMYYWIYTFHMPLFIFISGFLMRYSYKGVHSMAEYRSYVGRRFRKFALPYIMVGVACALLASLGKGVARFFLSSAMLLVAPRYSDARYLWYIYMILVFYCLAPLVFNVRGARRWALFAVALLISPLALPTKILSADYFVRFFVFFLSGALVAENCAGIRQIPKRWYVLPAVVFVGMTVLLFKYGNNAILEYAMQWIGIPACACAAWLLEKCRPVRDALVRISQDSFAIYLYHMFIIQAGALLLTRLPWAIPSWGYIVYLLVSVTVSIGLIVWGKEKWRLVFRV